MHVTRKDITKELKSANTAQISTDPPKAEKEKLGKLVRKRVQQTNLAQKIPVEIHPLRATKTTNRKVKNLRGRMKRDKYTPDYPESEG